MQNNNQISNNDETDLAGAGMPSAGRRPSIEICGGGSYEFLVYSAGDPCCPLLCQWVYDFEEISCFK